MTIDERLERLTERHEALTQTVEIIAGMQKETERKLDRLTDRVTQIADLVGDLVQIVRRHEERLDAGGL